MEILEIALQVLLVIASILMILLILMHKGSGGGLSDMFGGGVSSSLGSAGNAQSNLNKLTTGVALVWVVAVVLLGLILKVQ